MQGPCHPISPEKRPYNRAFLTCADAGGQIGNRAPYRFAPTLTQSVTAPGTAGLGAASLPSVDCRRNASCRAWPGATQERIGEVVAALARRASQQAKARREFLHAVPPLCVKPDSPTVPR
jgi:hypothetical protein